MRLAATRAPRALALRRTAGGDPACRPRAERDATILPAIGRAAMAALDVEPRPLSSSTPTASRPSHRRREPVLVAVAARVGDVRLIDNDILERSEETPMQRTMLKSKIHRATSPGCDLHYVGSITIDADRSRPPNPRARAGPVVDVDNGRASRPYTIAAERGSGRSSATAPPPTRAHGDTDLVISYASTPATELREYEPRVVPLEAGTPASSTSTPRSQLLRSEKEGADVPPIPARSPRARSSTVCP